MKKILISIVAICCCSVVSANPDVSTNRVAVVYSDYKVQKYSSELSGNDFNASVWRNDRATPDVSIKEAILKSKAVVRKFVTHDEFLEQWDVRSVVLSLPHHDKSIDNEKCYYIVQWRGGRREFKKQGGLLLDQYDTFRIIVLMNGKAIIPKPLKPNKLPNEN